MMDEDMRECDPEVELLRRQMLQMVNIRQLVIPKGSHLVKPTTQSALYDGIFSRQAPAGSEGYRYKVLKRILESISEACTDPDEDEISDDLASCLGSLMMGGTSTNAGIGGTWTMGMAEMQTTEVVYTAPQSLRHTVPESSSIIISEAINFYSGAGTTGHRTWEAALHLSHFLCSGNPSAPEVRGRKVLELGAGRGLVSYVCAAVCGAAVVIPTDGTEPLVDDLKKRPPGNPNPGPGPGQDEKGDDAADRRASSNQTHVKCEWLPHVLDWEQTDDDDDSLSPSSVLGSLSSLPEPYKTNLDLILGADITFDERILPALCGTLAALLRRNPEATCLIAATVRNERTLGAFRGLCSSLSPPLTLDEIPTKSIFCPDGASLQTGLFHGHEVPVVICGVRIGKGGMQ